MRRLIVILLTTLIGTACLSQTHERWDVKSVTDGFVPDLSTVRPITVAELQKRPINRVGNTQPRFNFEKTVVRITGTVVRVSLETDGDYHVEINDGSVKDSTLACESIDPKNTFAAKSPMIAKFKEVRAVVKTLKVGDEVEFIGLLFQDKFHHPSQYRIRNFLEIHPILKATIIKTMKNSQNNEK